MIPSTLRIPLLRIARRLGYEVVKTNTSSELYGAILPGSTYSPWNVNREFMRTFEAIRKHTLVDLYRCYELWQIVDQLSDIPGDLLEVGVWRGGSGALIAKRAQISNIDGRIFLCDTFNGVVKASKNDNAYTGGEHADTSEEAVVELLAAMDLNNTLILRGVFPDDTASEISSRNFRFVHIDVDVYQSAKEITDWAWPRLSTGGVIIYDDYGTESTIGVTRLVNEQQGLADRLTIYNINGHALVIKLR